MTVPPHTVEHPETELSASGTGNQFVDAVTSAERRRLYERSGAWDKSTLPAMLRRHAAANPSADAVIDLRGERIVSRGELAADVERLSGWLLARGIGIGDVVSVQLPNWYETVVVDLAVLAVGAILNPLLPLYRATDLRKMLTTSRSKLIVTPDIYRGHDFGAMIAEVAALLDNPIEHVAITDPVGTNQRFGGWLDAAGGSAVAGDRSSSTVSELIFTSGTEAAPKAIMHTEQTTNHGVRSLWNSLKMGDEEVVWMPSPIGHSTGLNYGVRFAIYLGLSLVLQDRWSAADAAMLVERFSCSYTLAATTFLADLVEHATEHGARLESLRYFGSGGAPVPASLVEAARAVGVNVLRLYGSTELLCATWNRRDSPSMKRLLTDGLPLDDVEIEVRDENGVPVCDKPGEIFGRSPNACVGFFGDPERTDATFRPDGWIRTGDLGVLDSEGYLTIVGRKKEIIIRGGLNISPREIEDLLTEIPGVARNAIVGLPNARLGEIVCACVVPHADTTLDLESMIAALRARGLATFKLPQALVLFDELPTTTTGKVRKHELISTIMSGAVEIDASTVLSF